MLLGILGACGNKKTNIDPFASITKEVDSIRRVADSIHCDESPEDPQPIQADESFDDFIYNFASDDVLQRQRVKFPLPYYNGDKKTNIEEHNWKHDDLFTKQHYYTLLFDREEDMDLVGDTPPGGGTTDYAVDIYYSAVKGEKFVCPIKQGTLMDMMYMPDALNAAITLMEADPTKLIHRNAFNIASMSFDPETIYQAIRKHVPQFEMIYDIDPLKQRIADSWPDSLDDTCAREEWGWKPAYDLESMTVDMLEKLREKLK